MPGLGQLVREIGGSWDAFLHLYGAEHLAACVRAAAETGLVLSGGELGPAATERKPAESGASSSGSGSEPGGSKSGSASTSSGSSAAGRGLLQRSLDVLLDRSGQELVAAGPQVRSVG